MAGFGSISLVQTAIGTLLDQRAVVLYKQPQFESGVDVTSWWGNLAYEVSSQLWGNQFRYDELFSGLLSNIDADTTMLERLANVTAANPYGISYLDARVDIESDLCEHPIENGTLITDASIILPVTAEVSVAMPTFFAERIYNQMYDLYHDKKTKIILQTKYGIYQDLVLQNISYELEYSKVDRTIFTLTLREIQEALSYGEFSFRKEGADYIHDSSDATTINMGTQIAIR